MTSDRRATGAEPSGRHPVLALPADCLNAGPSQRVRVAAGHRRDRGNAHHVRDAPWRAACTPPR